MRRKNRVLSTWLTDAAHPIAHRGLHCPEEGVPENSMAAFRAAMARGLPIELDVLLSADGQAVVFHDEDLARMTGEAGSVGGETAKRLRTLRLAGTGETIPLLADVLAEVGGQVPLLIEIKNLGGAVGPLERATLDTLAGYDGSFALQSFNPLSLRYIRNAAPQIARGQLAERSDDLRAPRLLRFALRNLLFNFLSRPDFIAYDIDALPNRATTRARRAGLPLLAWTVRDEAQRERARACADNYIFEQITPELP